MTDHAWIDETVSALSFDRLEKFPWFPPTDADFERLATNWVLQYQASTDTSSQGTAPSFWEMMTSRLRRRYVNRVHGET